MGEPNQNWRQVRSDRAGRGSKIPTPYTTERAEIQNGAQARGHVQSAHARVEAHLAKLK